MLRTMRRRWSQFTYVSGCCSSMRRFPLPSQRCVSAPDAVRPAHLSTAPCTAAARAAELERRRQTAAPQSISIGLHTELHKYLMLMRLVKAERVLEIGVFTGFTALGMALTLPAHGQLIACELKEKWTEIGKPYWRAAGVSDRIDLRIGAASHTLAGLLEQVGPESFDLAFIDANKSQYDLYYEASLQLLRPGGVVVVDNVLWKGEVINPDANDKLTSAIKQLNAKIFDDERVDICMLPTADGITIAHKR